MPSQNEMYNKSKDAKEQEIANATQQDLSQTQSEFWQLNADLNQMMSRLNLGQRRELQDVVKKFIGKINKQ